MYIDKNLEIADAVAVNTAIGANVCGVAVPHEYTGYEPNSGRNLFLVVTVAVAFTSGGAATVSFGLVSDAQTPAVAATATVHATSGPIPVAALTVGKRIIIPIPEGALAYEGYLGLVTTVATAILTAGTVNAFITMDAERWRAFPEGVP